MTLLGHAHQRNFLMISSIKLITSCHFNLEYGLVARSINVRTQGKLTITLTTTICFDCVILMMQIYIATHLVYVVTHACYKELSPIVIGQIKEAIREIS